MRWILAIVGVVLVAVAAVMLAKTGGTSGTGPGAATTGQFSDSSDASSAGAEAGGGAAGGSQLAEPERRALAELEEEIERAAPVAYRSDEERLADARAWVSANRAADRPYNEIEAKILALMEVLADGDERSAEWTMNMSQIEVEMIRAIDADGDGQVSDGEVQAFVDENLNSLFNPMEHPYLQEKFDTDGDGAVSPEEMMAFASEMNTGALAGAIERGRLEPWDSDDDGFISENERVAGKQAAYDKVDEMFQQFTPDANLDNPDLTEEERASIDAKIAEQMEAARAQLDSTREMMAAQMAAQELMEAMRLDNLPQPDPAELMKEMPQPPTDALEFDADGDGSLNEAETAAQTEAMLAYQDEVERWGAELAANRLREQFEHATSQHDTDGDARMSELEWESRIDDLLDERDQRLFLGSYDLDQSGRVDAGELSTYLDWYRHGSLRADANYDGVVNGRDLEDVATRFQRQGR